MRRFEFTPVAAPTIACVNFFEMRMKDAVNVLERLDPAFKLEFDGATSLRFGLALWTSEARTDEQNSPDEDDDDDDWDRPEGNVHSVLIAPAEYFARS